ncbi:hypothetical protein Q0N40_00820 [Corynebacterium pseudokroppenstedtii]|uniref:Secreted protein n=1 Tax=Corynebacterium pseudokroppenstedtii TaxID=2804917 RepID=A0AAU0PZZ6_9CORY|nr:hypothetical protein [Corynebacterium pseudokroppenstedtii]MDU6478636.1 hypothetical protein [Corynebacterium kroppenstedtii]MBY0791269.1 hypothetical protein [Corynebacterium pseudokroppenstedtii]MCF6793512.1 hypothetical protein [Corynebacterium pseudokroppenstedtii]MCG2636542.1 hypothetical protein [Corynebacterium pseudokroppenstedtii]MDU7502937.1 hypothetical protein [Corynebacterium kroppenstedtii]
MGIESGACLLRPSVASVVDLAVAVLVVAAVEAVRAAKTVAVVGFRARVD